MYRFECARLNDGESYIFIERERERESIERVENATKSIFFLNAYSNNNNVRAKRASVSTTKMKWIEQKQLEAAQEPHHCLIQFAKCTFKKQK